MRKFPNALVIMLGFILFASLLSYVIPHGQYERITDPETGKVSVVSDSYQVIESAPVSVMDTFIAIPEGIVDRADLIALILLIGGCFYVIEKTGALKEGIEFLAHSLKGKEEVVLVLVGLIFLLGGAMSGLQEEIIAMTVVLVYLTSRLGYNAFVAIAISYGSAIVGASFSPINPFAVVIAQEEAGLEFLSGAGFRLIFMAIAFMLWMTMVIRYANKNKIVKEEHVEMKAVKLSKRSMAILGLVVLAFLILVYGMLKLDWGFNQMTAEFFVLGLLVGIIGKMGINGTAECYIEGFKEMTFAAIIVGLSSSISIVLEKGMIIDSIIYGLFKPMQYLPESLAGITMLASQSVLHFAVPSYSGQAVLTMPILSPLSDLIGLSRQVCVLAYQYGAVMTDLLIPTNGSLMAVLAIAGISFDKWFKFIFKRTLVIFLLGAVAIIVATYIGI